MVCGHWQPVRSAILATAGLLVRLSYVGIVVNNDTLHLCHAKSCHCDMIY